jgi:hypothetical protein
MTGIIANLLLNVLMVGLLAATISYCWVLNRRIKVLQDSKSELAQLLSHFDESTQRASDSIIALQTASKRIGENIQHRIDKANFLIDDLNFMIERGSKLTSQMEAGLAVSRARSRVMTEQEAPSPPPAAMPTPPMMLHEEPASAPAPRHGKERAVASLEAVLERVVGRGRVAENDDEPKPARSNAAPARARSKAEQELLEMIKGGIRG